MDRRPFYKRKKIDKIFDYIKYRYKSIDFSNGHIDSFYNDPFNVDEKGKTIVELANERFYDRAAAAIRTLLGNIEHLKLYPSVNYTELGFIITNDSNDPDSFLDVKFYDGYITWANEGHRFTLGENNLFHLTTKCLAAVAFADYFPHSDPQGFIDPWPDDPFQLRAKVSEAIMKAGPGWCGTFGPLSEFNIDKDDLGNSLHPKGEGNYDFGQVLTLLPLIYSYYDELTSGSREKLISELLAGGTMHRPDEDDKYTREYCPSDWSRAGFMHAPWGEKIDLPETENHVLMIGTVRYLTNQLLYQRNQDSKYDNRRNGCMNQLTGLLRNQLRNDFAEYNAKSYQEETRHALLNLYSYAYESEVRLGAHMVLDYISAHIAVSSNDLRRIVPFRRRNEGDKVKQIDGIPGFMDVGLLDDWGADPMSPQFALLAGNTRAYRRRRNNPYRDKWNIRADYAPELTIGSVCDYRLPNCVHDLFVNDIHRRFFQRLHRRWMEREEPGGQRNCENMEIYSSSPSYLITAGGKPSQWCIPGDYGHYDNTNMGIAMPITFLPTGLSVGADINPNDANQLIQILQFSDDFEDNVSNGDHGATLNYGIAPDFACGYRYWLPPWLKSKWNPDPSHVGDDGIFFFDSNSRRSISLRQEADLRGFFGFSISARDIINSFGFSIPFSLRELLCNNDPACFYLAIVKYGDFILLEAYDAWLHSELTFEGFKRRVKENNPQIVGDNLKNYFVSNQETLYKTINGNAVHFTIWCKPTLDVPPSIEETYGPIIADHLRIYPYNHRFGSKIIRIDYGEGDPVDTLKDADNYDDIEANNDHSKYKFLSGTIMKSIGEGLISIYNPWLGQTLTLDWSDPTHLIRTSEEGSVEHAGISTNGKLFEVWVDFSWQGDEDGDFFHPCRSISKANDMVADGGVIKIMPGVKEERTSISKRVTIQAPLREVTFGK